MEEDIGSEAIFIRQPSDAFATGQPFTRWHDDPPRWHLIDPPRALTWCGLDIGYGNRRLSWNDTPKDLRCQLCLGRLGRMIHRSRRSP